ncbi:MAG: beta-galactosidase, partial [Akkermansiaceae bacterium]|nr:beta-galactosidase [Akkermansiaceae bacterium]
YYWADKLGLMVWQDMPSAFARGKGENLPRGAAEDVAFSDSQAEGWREEWEAIMSAFGSHPSIVAWIPFNEGWGQHRT